MEQIVITKPDSSTWSLLTKSAVTMVTRAEQRKALLGEDVIAMSVESSAVLDIEKGDMITVFGSPYFLNKPPKHTKKGKNKHSYDLTWEGRQYDLLRPLYLDEGIDGVSISPDFSLTGTLEFFMNVLINNANRLFGAGKWALGECPVTDYRTLTFSNEKCLAVLQRLCKLENFNKEFEIIENGGVCTINIKDTIGGNHATTYEYGKGNGLWELTRDPISEKDPITRLYVFGSNKNLRSDYRGFSQRLKLPGNNLSYLEDAAAIAQYGLTEGVQIFDNIFPHRTGSITSLGSTVFEFIDSSMDFDINATNELGDLYKIPGIEPKIHFNTGNLAGYQFTISYDHSTKKFTLQQFADERGQKFPDENSSAFQFNTGDDYVLIDIIQPQSYIDVAEMELQTAGEVLYSVVKESRVRYSETFDELYFKQKYSGQATVNVFSIGDYVHIKDSDIGVDKAIRLKSFRRDVLKPYRYNLDLYDYNEETLVNKLLSSSYETSKIITANKLNDNSAGYDALLVKALLSCLTIVNAGTANAYLRGKLPFACDGNIQGGSDHGQFPGTIWDGMPHAVVGTWGAVLPPGGATTFLRADGTWAAATGGGFNEAGNYAPSGTWAFTQTPTVGGVAVSLSNHLHDDRYFTESEISTALGNKADLIGGVVPSAQLPSYVDDVLEYANFTALPANGEAGKIYVTLDNNITYRWSGSAYIEISASLALGVTSATAYRGDFGAIAYTHSQAAHQTIINGTGFVKTNGTSLSYDNSTYLTTSAASGTYAPLASPTFSGTLTAGSIVSDGINNYGNVTSKKNMNIGSNAYYDGQWKSFGSAATYGFAVLMSTAGHPSSNPYALEMYVDTAISGPNEVLNWSNIFNIGVDGKVYALGGTSTDWNTAFTHSQSGHQTIINGTGFVKASGTTISFDNSTYLTTAAAAITYAPLANPVFTGEVTAGSFKLGNYTFAIVSDKLVIKYGSTVVASYSSAGFIKALDNIQGGVAP